VNAIWMIVLAVGVTAVATAVRWSQGRGGESDLGSVSHRWVAEHRLSQTQDPR